MVSIILSIYFFVYHFLYTYSLLHKFQAQISHNLPAAASLPPDSCARPAGREKVPAPYGPPGLYVNVKLLRGACLDIGRRKRYIA
jgi:hypothetical protein